MSYKKTEFIFSVPISDVKIGIPVGFEVEFSLNSAFSPVLYRITTFEEITSSIQGVFYYSLDDGLTWIDFPVGEYGQIFYGPYKIKVVVNSADANFIFAEKQGTLYRIAADGREIIDSYSISNFNSTGLGIDRNNNLYVSGENKTCYKISTFSTFKPCDYSLNLHSEPLGITVDESRNTLWQVDRNKVSLKDLNGNLIFSTALPIQIDTDYSSSSSSSLSSSSVSSSSSSSSTYIKSSSSSSTSSHSVSTSSTSSSSSSSTYIRSSSSSSSYSSSSKSSDSSSSSSSNFRNWEPRGVLNNWRGVAMSSNGSSQTAVPYGDYIYTSSDYGETWSQTATSQNWFGIAMSSNGSSQTATTDGGTLYTSHDYGNTWSSKGSSLNWRGVAMSSNGSSQTAVAYGDNVYTSHDYGETWTAKLFTGSWVAVDISSNASSQTTGLHDSFGVYKSNNFGNNWVQDLNINGGGSVSPACVALSSNGSTQVVIQSPGNGAVFVSHDYGNTWSQKTALFTSISGVDVSDDGSIQVIASYGNKLYVSYDYGNTWIADNIVRNWYDVAISSNGSSRTAVVDGGYIYKYVGP